MRGLALGCLALLAAPCWGAPGDLWGVATLASHHFTDRKFEQHNYGLGFEAATRFARLSVIGGAYENSFRKVSAYAGGAWTPLGLGPLNVGGILGLVTGYHQRVALLPTAQFEHGRFGANVFYVPKLGDDCAVLGFQVKGRF